MPKFLIETRIDIILQEIIEANNEEEAHSRIEKGIQIARIWDGYDILDCEIITDEEAKALQERGVKTI